MPPLVACVAFVPLSNWLIGFDRYRQVFDKGNIPSTHFPDAFYLFKEGEDASVGYIKVQSFIARRNLLGDRVVAIRALLPESADPEHLSPNTHTGTGVGWRWPSPVLPLSGVAWADSAQDMHSVPIEAITAQAYQVDSPHLFSWSACRPRSFSVLPITMACNASCAFCFSKASVSTLARQIPIDLERMDIWAAHAAHLGAARAVITGGGEPMLLPFDRLCRLVETLRAHFPKIVLITNGSRLASRSSAELLPSLRALVDSGLTCLAVSRHGFDEDSDASILGLQVPTSNLMRAIETTPSLKARSICVLQKNGVHDASTITAYLRRCAAEGVRDVCFKELYVSSLSENPWAPSAENTYAQIHQVPLVRVIDTLTDLGFRPSAELPWGSPVFEGTMDGVVLSVAAYTEPSVGWERRHALARSWNYYTDDRCLASLEDPSSVLPSPDSRSFAPNRAAQDVRCEPH